MPRNYSLSITDYATGLSHATDTSGILGSEPMIHALSVRASTRFNTSSSHVLQLRHFGSLCDWIDREADIWMDMSTRSFLFGVAVTRPQDKVVNNILLFVKYYIYRQKLFHDGKLSLIQLLRELRARLHTERYIPTLENKPNLFQQWNRIYQALG